MTKSVLKRDLQKNDPYQFCTWMKETRLARRELAALYRAKEKYDEERTCMQALVRHLRSVGVDAGVVERAHYRSLFRKEEYI